MIYRPDFYNLQTRKVWNGTNSTNRTFHKLNSNTTRSQIWIHAYVTGHLQNMFYNWKTQLMQFTDWQIGWKIYKPDKKSVKSIGVLEINFS